jgi:[acyl-carrier-protein] S-malonyltransferase
VSALAGPLVAAEVDGQPVTVAEVDARLAALRATPVGSRLPGEHTAEGRNARRWVVQLLAARRIVEREVAVRGLPAGPREAAYRRPLLLESALALGGVAAATLAEVPGASVLADQFSSEPDEDAVRDYYARNLDLFAGSAYEDVRGSIAAQLAASARDRAFALWLERRMAESVCTAAGYEHPATPGSPDATHRH